MGKVEYLNNVINNILEQKPCNNKTTNPFFLSLCKMSQEEIKKYLFTCLSDKYEEAVYGDGFLYAKGNIPVLLTAHMDTVHKELVREWNEEDGKLSSPQGIGGDDRCGIFMILKIIEDGYKPSILFCEDEEVGGIGSNKFIETIYVDDLSEMKYLIELDRANNDDAVFYDCGNREFVEFIEEMTGYKEAWGSFSDIGHLSPACDRASVNLSCGYYNAHTTSEYVVLSEMEHTIKVVEDLLSLDYEKMECFDYQEKKYGYYGYGYGHNSSWYDDYDEEDYYYNKYYKSSQREVKPKFSSRKGSSIYMEICYLENGKENWDSAYGDSIKECIGSFLMGNPEVKYEDVIDYDLYDAEDVR